MSSATTQLAHGSPPHDLPQHSHGLVAQGPWLLAWACQVGSRHLQHGKPCEDSVAYQFQANKALALACADGISGGAAGDVASGNAVRYCTGFEASACIASPDGQFGTPQCQTTLWADAVTQGANPLQAHLDGLDAHVQQAIAKCSSRAGATTLAAAWLQADGTCWLTHLGDVRAYRHTPAALQRITQDHTYTNAGETPPHLVPADNPNRMAGNGFGGQPPLQTFQLLPGECLLLCTDGLHGFLTDAQINNELHPLRHAVTHALARLPAITHAVARRLLRKAVAAGSDDDIAVQVLWRAGNRG